MNTDLACVGRQELCGPRISSSNELSPRHDCELDSCLDEVMNVKEAICLGFNYLLKGIIACYEQAELHKALVGDDCSSRNADRFCWPNQR